MSITPALIERAIRFLTEHGIELLELEGLPPPTIATVREIDIKINANKIETEYSRANYTVDINNFGGLGAVLQRVANNTLSLPDNPRPKAPYKSQLSLQNKTYCYVILKLTGKNWQFSRDRDPFSIGLSSTDPEVYFEPRKVDAQGGIVPRGEVRDECRIAYFIADGATAYDDATAYEDPFNLHLDLIDEDSHGQPSPVPIIIDPDVRFPGGSGELSIEP